MWTWNLKNDLFLESVDTIIEAAVSCEVKTKSSVTMAKELTVHCMHDVWLWDTLTVASWTGVLQILTKLKETKEEEEKWWGMALGSDESRCETMCTNCRLPAKARQRFVLRCGLQISYNKISNNWFPSLTGITQRKTDMILGVWCSVHVKAMSTRVFWNHYAQNAILPL